MMNWYVIYVKSRNEKKVALQLEKIGVKVFCPMVMQIRQWSDRTKKVEIPLLNSYVFVKLEAHEREVVFQVPGVVRYIYWLEKPAIVREQEIEVLQEGLKEAVSEIRVTQLKPGDIMDISSGPFKGKQGVVKEINKNSVQILLQGLGLKIRLTKA